jgi:chlorophyll(ide) b reductase
MGKALATEFIRAGDSVVITSRDPTRVSETVGQLTSLIPSSSSSSQKIVGLPGDVSSAEDVKALGQFALDQLGSIDIWINNAGSNAYSFKPLIEQTPEEIESIIDTNILGSLLCCRQAITLMSQQTGRGHIFLMDGAGADGGPTPRFAAYGATKRSLQQLSKSLSAELRSAKLQDKIAVHNLSPGMVITDLLMAGADTKVSRWFINRLAERPETVAKNLVPRVRQVVAEASPLPIAGIPSAYVRFLTKPTAYSKILKGLIGVGKNRFVNEDD